MLFTHLDQPRPGRTGLIQAANTGQTEIVQFLLDKGANVNAVDTVCVMK